MGKADCTFLAHEVAGKRRFEIDEFSERFVSTRLYQQ